MAEKLTIKPPEKPQKAEKKLPEWEKTSQEKVKKTPEELKKKVEESRASLSASQKKLQSEKNIYNAEKKEKQEKDWAMWIAKNNLNEAGLFPLAKKPDTTISVRPPEVDKTEKKEQQKNYVELTQEQKIEKTKDEYSKSVWDYQEAQVTSIEEINSLEHLDPESAKQVHTELIIKSINPDNLSLAKKREALQGIKWGDGKDIDLSKITDKDLEKLTQEQKNFIRRSNTLRQNADKLLSAYETDKNWLDQKWPDYQKKIQELLKINLWLQNFNDKQTAAALDLSILKSDGWDKKLDSWETSTDIVRRVLAEKAFSGLIKTLGNDLKWQDVPDSIKKEIQSNPLFQIHKEQLPKGFYDTILENREKFFTPQQPEETVEVYKKRLKDSAGINTDKEIQNVQKSISRKWLSPFVKFLADLLAPLGALMGGEAGDFWRRYLSQNPSQHMDASGRYASHAVNFNWKEYNGALTGYDPETHKEATENAKKSAEIIKQAFQKAPTINPDMQKNLATVVDRHAQNDPHFSSDQPFLAQDISTQTAFIYYPGGRIETCSATHGTNGINNKNNSHGSSLGSKRLTQGWKWDGMKYRLIVDGLEWCNANDKERLIRVHEQHWSATYGCTGLPETQMAAFDAAVGSAGWGAQETFQSATISRIAKEKSQKPSEGGKEKVSDMSQGKEQKEKITKIISYAEAKKMIESGVQPTDPPTIYKVDMSTYSMTDRYKWNTDPAKWEDAAHRNLTSRWKEFIAIHGTASGDISWFHMMLDSGLFPYFISQKWLIFQGADDMTTWSAVSTKTANPNMQKYGLENFNNRGIGVEVSLLKDGKGGVVRPNEAQKRATSELVTVLRGAHNIGPWNILTSADPVRDLNTWELLPGAHGDDFSDEDRKSMGIALSGDVRERLKTGQFFTDKMATNDSQREQETMNSEFTTSSQDSQMIDQIKQNESGDTNGNEWYAWWNSTEHFPSMGFAHFIWWTNTGHGNSFYDMMSYITQSKWITVPPELKFLQNTNPPSNWKDLSSMQGDPKYSTITDFLSRNDVKKAGYDFIRDSRLYSLSQKLTGDTLNKFNQLAKWPKGAYILIDYVNFKWEGLTGSNQWGLKQVLENMSNPTDPVDAAKKFRDSAQKLLAARRDSGKYIAGWTNRLNTYTS